MFPMLFLICNSTVELLMRTFKTFKCLLFMATSIALSPRMFFLVRRKGKWSTMNFVILVLPKLVVSYSKKFLMGSFKKMFDNESCLLVDMCSNISTKPITSSLAKGWWKEAKSRAKLVVFVDWWRFGNFFDSKDFNLSLRISWA